MTSIDVLLQSIFTFYFSSSRCLILISDQENSWELQPNIPILVINPNKTGNLENMFNYVGCQEFIITSKRPVSIFERLENEMKQHQDRFNKRRYVFTPTKNQQENPFDISESPWLQYVSDVLIIISEKSIINRELKFWNKSEDVYGMWTHKYVGESGNNEFYMLDKWFSGNQSFLFNYNLFPDKLTNQEGRTLRSAIFFYEPYVIFEPRENGTYFYMGSEMVTLLTFAHHYNMTLVPVINEQDYWGEIWENQTGIGLLGNLIAERADIGAAALFTWESAYKLFDLTKPTVRSGITCLVPAPELAAGWMTPVRVYSVRTWMSVMGTFVAISVVLYFLGVLQVSMEDMYQDQHNKILRKVIVSVFKPFIMQNVTEKEMIKGYLGSYLMGLVFLTALVLSTTYDSGLATIMTIPRYENPINTVDELVASGLYWGATQDGWITSIKEAKEPNLVQLVERFVSTTKEELHELSFTGKFGYAIERLPHGNHAVGSYIQRDVIQNYHLMTEDIYWELAVMMLRKNSVLLPYLDMWILRTFEAGLISFWQNEATAEYMDQYVQTVVRYLSHHQKERGIVKLQITHVQGAFGILAFGSGLALVVFLIELSYDTLWKRVIES